MPRYWIIAPAASEPSDLFDKVWQFDRANNLISIGWKGLGDVSKMSRQELAEVVASTYPDRAKGLITNMLWAFYHEIGPDDIVLARRGRKILAGVGKVTQPAVYSPGKNPHITHPHFLGVAWEESPRDKVFPSIVFPMHTLQETSSEKFKQLIAGATDGIEPPNGIENRAEFVLEKYLEEFLVGNFQAIFKGSMNVYEDSEGNTGQQYDTEVGPIDILAWEPVAKSFVIIELKKGRSTDQVIGQVLRYMGWVKKNLCNADQGVKGLIICRDIDPKLSYALEMTKNIDVRYYTVSFRLSEKPQDDAQTA